MSELEKISVNVIGVTGEGFNVKYMIQGRDVDKSDHPRKDLFQPGRYPFYWPGAVSVFGGEMEPNETPEQGALRELSEELQIRLSREQLSSAEMRSYVWKRDAQMLYEELNDFFHGNLDAFFGPNLHSKIPSCVLGKERKKFESKNFGYGATYWDWLKDREDHYLAADFSQPLDLSAKEGIGAIWLPHWVTRSIHTSPCDKFALLDDMMKRAKAGKLYIQPRDNF